MQGKRWRGPGTEENRGKNAKGKGEEEK